MVELRVFLSAGPHCRRNHEDVQASVESEGPRRVEDIRVDVTARLSLPGRRPGYVAPRHASAPCGSLRGLCLYGCAAGLRASRLLAGAV